MNEHLYGIDTSVIATLLLASMLAATEVGYRVGLRRRHGASEAARDHVNGIQGAILGILALLLGFSFSLALERHDRRSEAVVDEANAIGTAYLRVDLLPPAQRAETMASLRDYLDLRVASSLRPNVAQADRQAAAAQTGALQAALWSQARRAVESDPTAYPPTLFVEAVNDLIDSYGRRDAALDRHVPEIVLLLLFTTFLMASAIVGLTAGVAGHRPSLTSHIMIVLIVVLVFVILDLDRPRRGLIQVSQRSLLELQATLRAAGATSPVPAARPTPAR